MLEIIDVLESLKDGKISVSKAKKLLSLYSIEKIEDFAQIDMGRRYRKGIPEVVFAERKQTDEIKKIVKRVLAKSNSVLVSRITKQDYPKIISFAKKNRLKIKQGKNTTALLFYKNALRPTGGKVGIITAGTSDIGVAEEARLTCEAMNCSCICSYDAGIAGLHRTFPIIKKFIEQDVDVIIVAAGMEGALASVVSSLVEVPVIGLPTSVGYGYGEKGVAALASMLQSCSLGLSVVNIDNGIGAGAVASNIANKVKNSRR
jgi:NCAIR mutase (PurE)-related protein